MNLKNIGKYFVGIILGTLILGSAQYGTPSPLRWIEVERQIKRERQEYNKLYSMAVKCVEKDKIAGLTSLEEINELYSRAGIKINLNPTFWEPETLKLKFPKLTRGDLEKVVQSCEIPVKKK